MSKAKSTDQTKEKDPIELNREIAYVGEIGKKRRDFCIDYIEKKQEELRQIRTSQLRAITENHEYPSCHDGCPNCCYLYFQASLQECEAAVYYLYENPDKLDIFLNNYRPWRKKLKDNGDIFKECARLWYGFRAEGAKPEAKKAFEDAATRYQQQILLCPFVNNDGSCIIHEVRPYLCADTVCTSPEEDCHPKSGKTPKYYKTKTPALFDKSFYFGEMDGYVFAFFPITVYDILEGGYHTLAEMTGIEDLKKAAMSQPEVKAIIENLP